MTAPARKAAQRAEQEELAAVAAEIVAHEKVLEKLRPRRDELLLKARRHTPPLSLRDAAALGQVSHQWIRKLERREGA